MLLGDSPRLSMSLMVRHLHVISITSLFPHILAPALALISVAAHHSLLKYFVAMVLASFPPPSYTGLAFQSSFLNDSQFTSDLFLPSALISINLKVHMDDQK